MIERKGSESKQEQADLLKRMNNLTMSVASIEQLERDINRELYYSEDIPTARRLSTKAGSKKKREYKVKCGKIKTRKHKRRIR